MSTPATKPAHPDGDGPASRPGVDLAALADTLASVAGTNLGDYLRGKTVLRNAVSDHLHCSLLVAETLVDELEARGHVAFLGDPSRAATKSQRWRVGRAE